MDSPTPIATNTYARIVVGVQGFLCIVRGLVISPAKSTFVGCIGFGYLLGVLNSARAHRLDLSQGRTDPVSKVLLINPPIAFEIEGIKRSSYLFVQQTPLK